MCIFIINRLGFLFEVTIFSSLHSSKPFFLFNSFDYMWFLRGFSVIAVLDPTSIFLSLDSGLWVLVIAVCR